MPKSIRIRDFIKSVIVFTVVMEFIGAACFFYAFKQEGMPTLEALWSGIFHSVSSFCTAGFSLNSNSFENFKDHTFINMIITVLAISGSLGFIVITDFWYRLSGKSKRLTFTTKLVFYGFVLLLTIGTLFIYFNEPLVQDESGKQWLRSFFQAASAMTTVGFNTVSIGNLSLSVLLVIIFLMYIGASPSGTAGGMKITTLTAMLAILKSRLSGSKMISFLGKKIPFERLYVASASFVFYTSLIFFSTFLLTLSEKQSFDSLMFEAASALGTVGLSTGITGALSVTGKIIVIFLMFMGRVGVITFGFALLAKKNQKKHILMPEEDIAV